MVNLFGVEVADEDAARGLAPAQARMFADDAALEAVRRRTRDRLNRAVQALAKVRELTWNVRAQEWALPSLSGVELAVAAEDLRGAVAYLEGLVEAVETAADAARAD